MKQGNYKSRKARKKALNGCHRGTAPMGVARAGVAQVQERSLGAVAMAIAARLMFGWRRGKR